MLTIRPAAERGRVENDWLTSRHSFSFGSYFDPAHMGFGALRVINEDRVAPKGGFAPHGHRDMEIISYVLDGALDHHDSIGNGSTIRPGDVQRMSAGTGIRHSEFNHSDVAPVHFLQIWIEPDREGLTPSYEQVSIGDRADGRFALIASPAGGDNAVTAHQDVAVYVARLEAGDRVTLPLDAGRRAWIQIARGRVSHDGVELAAGDGAALTDVIDPAFEALEPSEVLAFDLA